MKVLYIVGVGRSGSTLLERMLGAVPGSVNAGELNAIFSRVATQDQRCGCGEPFSACPFWQAVGDRAFGGWGSVTKRMASLQPRVVRQRFVPHLATGLAGRDVPPRAGRVPRRPPPPLPRDLGRSPGPRSSSTPASRPPSSSPCAGSTAWTCGSSTWSATRAASPTPGASPGSASPSRSDGRRRWGPTPRTGWPSCGPASSWSPPSSEPRRRTPPGSATRTSSTVPDPRSTAALRGVGLSPEDGALDHVGENSVDPRAQPRDRRQPYPLHCRPDRAAARRRLAHRSAPRAPVGS